MNGNSGPGIVISPVGTVSVGPIPNTSTLEPKATLQVHGDYYGRGHLYLHAFEGDGQNGTAYIQARDLPNGRPPSSSIRLVLRTQFNGEVRNGIEISPDGNTVKLHVLEILGGADVAEPFPVGSADVPKGAVLVIDEEHPGQLKLSDRAYDTRVAGIVSGANGVKPGLTLSQQGVLEGGQNVALSGRVYVLADAANAPIRPGDLLTTSAVSGHAMKVTDSAKAQSAIIGKAMSRLDEGKGMVLVLVTL